MLNRAEDPALREEATNDLIRRLEAEQRAIGDAVGVATKIARAEAPDTKGLQELANSATTAYRAADAMTENRLANAATTGADNTELLRLASSSVDHSATRSRIEHLAAWQGSIERQVDALARERLDEALASRQDFLE